MAEFALILPLLGLLTFGMVEITLYVQQKSALIGAGFFAARTASVLSNETDLARASARRFAEAAGYGWLQEAVGGMQLQGAGESSRVRLTATPGGLGPVVDGLLALSTGASSGFSTLQADVGLPLEYVARRQGGGSVTTKRRTFSAVSYVDPAQAAVSGVGASAGAGLKALAGSAASVPVFPGLTLVTTAAQAPGREPYRAVAAVVPNPKNEGVSKEYVKPGYEAAASLVPGAYNVGTLVNELNAYGAGLQKDAATIASFAKTNPAAFKLAKPLVLPVVSGLSNGQQAAITKLEASERTLFR